MSGRPTTKTKTKEKGNLVDINPSPHLLEYLHRKNVQRGFERLERHPGTGYLGLPHKKGHGGKYTWEGPEGKGIADPPPVAVDKGDPNYIGEAQEEVDDQEMEMVAGVVEVAKAPAAPQGVARVEIAVQCQHVDQGSSDFHI